MTKEQDELFDDANIPESNWFKFDKVGAKIKGTLTEVYESQAWINSLLKWYTF